MKRKSSPRRNIVRRIRSRVAPLAKSALLRAGGCAAIRLVAPSSRLAILRYHAICGPAGYRYAAPGISISPRAFRGHVAYLAANYSVLSLPDAVEHLRTGTALPPNAVAITFDDGYADNLEAARELNRRGLSGTFFITSSCMDETERFWPAEIRMLVPLIRARRLTLVTDEGSHELALDHPAARSAAVHALTRLLKSVTIPVREALRDQIRHAAGNPGLPPCMLRWDQLAEMHRLGMTIGGHTMTHPNLPSAGLTAAAWEIAGCKTRLERELGASVTMFSYPNGGAERYYTPEIQQLVSSSGYAASSSSRNGFAGRDSDRYALERIEVEERLEDFAFALEIERFAFAPTERSAS